MATEAKGVAIPLEIVQGSESGSEPRVFRHVGTRVQESSRSKRLVSRRPDWGSAASVLGLWKHEIAAFKAA